MRFCRQWRWKFKPGVISGFPSNMKNDGGGALSTIPKNTPNNQRIKMAKKTANKNSKSFEETLWDSANKLRGTVESSEYKHVVLSLIFLKFASDKFEERKAELIADGKEKFSEMLEFYAMKNVFYL